jgi:hypothetical protein
LQIAAENNLFGEAAIRLAGDALLVIKNVFDSRVQEEFRKELTQLKGMRSKISAIGKGCVREVIYCVCFVLGMSE